MENSIKLIKACRTKWPVSYTHLDVYKRQLPKPPIAIPTLLNATTGASFTPSPIKQTVSFLAMISLTLFTLSSGSNCQRHF